MNYLAHAYFSFGHADILTGNMISDFVKGRKQFDYPEAIQQGIRLHREIDAFTDSHTTTQSIKKIFAPEVRLYAGAYADIVYDHFLALDPRFHSEEEWLAFSQETYRQLESRQSFFPETFARMFPYMRSQNWLFNYRYDWGVENSFMGLARRARYLPKENRTFFIFREAYSELSGLSAVFLADVKSFSEQRFRNLTTE